MKSLRFMMMIAVAFPATTTVMVSRADVRLASVFRSHMIAGSDHRFVKARARIEGEAVIVWSEDVSTPVAVRYAVCDPVDPNFFNQAGLPASPFRTHDWPWTASSWPSLPTPVAKPR